MTKDEKKRINLLETAIGYSFRKPSLLRKALVHKSYANEKGWPSDEHNERLEFLGDAVLELAVSELLMNRFPHFSEGELSKLRAAIVNEKQLAALARSFQLGDYLYLGRGEEQTSGREKNSLLADAYEALLGGVYLDRGFKAGCQVIHRHYRSLLDKTPQHEFYKDYKTELQERSQGLFRAIPRYCLIGEQGPDHDKVFEVEIYIQHNLMGQGCGRSKKEAEQEAARIALDKLSAAL